MESLQFRLQPVREQPPAGGTPTVRHFTAKLFPAPAALYHSLMPRLQFSIRALLLFMAVVGAALVVYRWPWSVTAETPTVTTTTQYRRGWNGKAVKHGRETKVFFDNIYIENWYDDGELRRERTVYADGMIIDKSVRNGVEDGPIFMQGAGVTTRGQHRQGKKEGIWLRDRIEVVITDTYRNGKLDGRSSWNTPEGKTLQSADYEEGRLVRWNGSPVPDGVQEWIAANIPDPELRKRLLSAVSPQLTSQEAAVRLHYGQVLYFVGDPVQHLDVQWDLDDQPVHDPPLNQAIAESILELALLHDRTLTYRFGVFSLVPITPQQLAWRDRTGVAEIRFEPGSAEEKFWLTPTAFDPWQRDQPAGRLNDMFSQDDSPIEIDTTAIDDLEKPYDGPTGSTLPPLPRVRRDLIGLHLDREGYYCELRDGKLVIKPHADSKRLQRK